MTEKELKTCPECGLVLQGKGWDGINTHWHANHEHIMPYKEAWPLIKEGRYATTNQDRQI